MLKDTWNPKYRIGLEQRLASSNAGPQERVDRQHSKGKSTAHERIAYLFDDGTFNEVGALVEGAPIDESSVLGDGVVTGYGLINGRLVFASAQDFTILGGTLGQRHSEKICRIMDMAMSARAPFISINDSGGARIEEGICALNGYSGIFYRNTKASGVIPQISVILGPCAGGACYSPAISDFIFMTRTTSQMFITGPVVIKAVTGEAVSTEELGGADVHSKTSGVCHFAYEDEAGCLDGVKRLLGYLPQNNCESAPHDEQSLAIDKSSLLESIVPDDKHKGYDVHQVIATLVDESSFLEVQSGYAKNIVVGFARMDGKTIGIVANQPSVMAGSLDIDASDKAARFVRFCDCFNIPLLSLVDVPGYMPGMVQERRGIIRHGAKLLYAFSEATVPKVSLIMRKAYGGAYIAMNSKGMGADMVFAWPIAELAVMGAEGAVDIINKKELKASANAEGLKARLIDEYVDKYLNPYIAAANGFIDEVILPKTTRKKVAEAFRMLEGKVADCPVKKHGNIPL